MGYAALAWAAEQDLPNTNCFAVLIALASFADERGRCWPSQATISEKTKLARETVNRTIGVLKSIGAIKMAGRQYHLAIGSVIEDHRTVTDDHISRETKCDPQSQMCDPRSQECDPQSQPSEPVNKPINEPVTIQTSPKDDLFGQQVEDKKPSSARIAFEAFNTMAEEAGLPKAQAFTDQRRKGIEKRLKDCGGLEGWDAALEKIKASDFCTGKKTTFRADLDFLIQSKSFNRLMEGFYDNRPEPTSTRAKPHHNQLKGFGAAISDKH